MIIVNSICCFKLYYQYILQVGHVKKFFQRKNHFIIFLHLLFLTCTLYYFWTQSRYPALDNKMFMGARNDLTGISFDNIWPVSDDASIIKKIVAGTVNWYYTNWKGMTFGLIFSTLFLSLFSFVKVPNVKSKWLRPLVGAFIGAPLGVCANCATPITQGFKASGVKDETSLAVTLSSPTLNIIALTILFNSFPKNLIILKLGTSLFAILILIPLLTSFFGNKDSQKEQENCNFDNQTTTPFFQSIKLFFSSILKSIFYISKTTLPLMLLAGILGSMIFELVGFEFFLNDHFSWLKLMAISAIGSILPVPMTFDVIFTQKLLSTQANISFLTTLLCTLGIFSIYPFMMFWKNFSPKIATALFVSVWALGVVAGGIVHLSDASMLSNFPISLYKKNPTEYIRQAIYQNCDKRDDKNACVKQLISFQVMKTGLFNLCSELPNESDRENCLFSHKVKKLGLDYEKCDEFNNPEKCRHQMFSTIVKNKIKKELPCKKNGHQKDPLCVDLNYLSVSAGHIRDPNCDKIKRSEIKDKCYSITSFIIAKSNKTISSGISPYSEKCSLIENSEERDACFTRLAQVSGDSKWCEKVDHQQAIVVNRCLVNALIKSDKSEKDLNKCNSLGDSNLKKLCSEEWTDFQLLSNLQFLRKISSLGKLDADTDTENEENLTASAIPQAKIQLSPKPFYNSTKENILFFPHQKRTQGNGHFSKLQGKDIGLEMPKSNLDDSESFFNGYGIASGDINNDFWQDLVVGSYQSINIFVNTGGEFKKIPLQFREKLFKEYQIFLSPINLALVDINNDGWLDLFVSNYDGNVFFVLNDKHYFSNPEFIILPRAQREYAISATFGDFDGNGYLDLFLGNGQKFDHNNNFLAHTSGENNNNELFLNSNGKFKYQKFNDNFGVSLSVLATDMTNHGKLDLIAGNDFEVSDKFYLGNGKGQFEDLIPSKKIIPATTYATMSYDTADIDNDLKLETFAIGMKRGIFFSTDYCSQFEGEDKKYCNTISSTSDAIRNLNFKKCDALTDEKLKTNCYARGIGVMAGRFSDSKLCSLIPDNLFLSKFLCLQHFKNRKYVDLDQSKEYEGLRRNVLLKQDESGKFVDITEKYHVENSHWGWNAKFADLDNDTWQDIYVANGRFKLSEIASNVFFHNLKGKIFKDETKAFGLTDFVDTSSYTYNDFNFDGSLDIISQGYISPLRVFKNNESKNHSITFGLNDLQGNRFGIGAKVYIAYNENGAVKKQMRELKAGGGYASFDPYIVHFGLADVKQIDSVEIKWITGESTIVNKIMPADQHYIITRK